ncbi:hypothetical protein DPMN_105808 [Dreissena polymorpha]|uniref:Uncharacterized protein n=1 Tax=Dreissena polymorpha TaxID=45954 RepID=A0A9D4K3V3_DREPO|nr:hypothetical protein DPMN_105808 [Dreissena polymorpha]
MEEGAKSKMSYWYALPGPVPGVGESMLYFIGMPCLDLYLEWVSPCYTLLVCPAWACTGSGCQVWSACHVGGGQW